MDSAPTFENQINVLSDIFIYYLNCCNSIDTLKIYFHCIL